MRELSKFRHFLESIKRLHPVMKPIVESFDVLFSSRKSLLEGIESKIDWNEFPDPMVQHGVEIMKLISDFGYEAYVVGGAVRDIAMGDKNVHDIDIATNMPIAEIKSKFKTVEYGGGERHGTVIVHFKGNDYELTQFRKDGDYSDGRRPDSVEFVNDFKEDTARRDFTINSMGIDTYGNIIDYHGGMNDIKSGTLKTVGNAEGRFTEDALRILRAVRFAARFDFKVDPDTLEAIKRLKDTVTTTSIERIRDELLKTIEYGGKKFGNALTLLADTGLWSVIIPEVALTPGKITAVNRANVKDFKVNFSILFSDMAPNAVDELTRRLKMTNDETKSIVFIVTALPLYAKLSDLPKQKALSIVTSPDFPLIRATYIALNGRDIDNVDDTIENISRFKTIVDRQKSINSLINDLGFKGAAFGNAVKEVNKWLFTEFERGSTPSDEEIKTFLGNLK